MQVNNRRRDIFRTNKDNFNRNGTKHKRKRRSKHITPGNRVLVLSWTDLENSLDLERREHLKKKNALKRAGDEAMLVQIWRDQFPNFR